MRLHDKFVYGLYAIQVTVKAYKPLVRLTGLRHTYWVYLYH